MKHYQLTGSKEDQIKQFIALLEIEREAFKSKIKTKYTGEKYNRCDTVDGNPTAAYKQCHPYVGRQTSCSIGVNGKIRGRGSYGD